MRYHERLSSGAGRLVLVVAIALLVSGMAFAQTAAPPQAKPEQQAPALDADTLWKALTTGNRQFVAGKLAYENLVAERKILAEGQYPPISILGCADSRVPPELVFNQSIGGLFVVRTAGNIADSSGIASLEFAISKKWTTLIVVLGHEACGAVEASMGMGDPASPHLLALAQRIRGSFYGVDWDARNPEAVKKATIANTRAAAASLLAQSSIIRQAVAEGRVKIVPAYYSLTTGEVTRID